MPQTEKQTRDSNSSHVTHGPDVYEQSHALAKRLEADKSAIADVIALKKTMSPVKYAELVRAIGAANTEDRSIDKKLPKVIIADKGGSKVELQGVDYAPTEVVAAPTKPADTKPAPAGESKPAERGYSDTAASIEKMLKDFRIGF